MTLPFLLDFDVHKTLSSYILCTATVLVILAVIQYRKKHQSTSRHARIIATTLMLCLSVGEFVFVKVRPQLNPPVIRWVLASVMVVMVFVAILGLIATLRHRLFVQSSLYAMLGTISSAVAIIFVLRATLFVVNVSWLSGPLKWILYGACVSTYTFFVVVAITLLATIVRSIARRLKARKAKKAPKAAPVSPATP